MEQKINDIIEYVNFQNLWTLDYKIRYIYIELGKLVHKDAMFFYTVLEPFLGTDKDLIYDLKKIKEITEDKSVFNEYVICHNVAHALKYIFDKCGIESKIMSSYTSSTYNTSEGSVEYKHYFNCVTGDNGRKYFMTLNADLPNIQSGLKTEHYGVDIPYIRRQYVDDGYKDIQAYDGEEEYVTVLTDEELEKIDKRIGYVNTYYNNDEVYYDDFFDHLKEQYKDNYAYFYNNVKRSRQYKVIFNILHNNTDLHNLVNKKIKEEPDFYILNIKNFNQHDYLKRYLTYSYFIYFNSRFNLNIPYGDFLYYVTSFVRLDSGDPNYNMLKKYFHDLVKEKNNKSVYSFNVLDNLIFLFKGLDKQKKGLDFDAEFFNRNLVFVLSYFMKDIYLPINNEPSMMYLNHKLLTSLKRVFDTYNNKTSFNNMEIAEQTFILKKVLSIIFQDVIYDEKNPKNRKNIDDYIITSTLIDKETREYKALIYIDNKKGNGFMPVVFDLKNNTISTDKSMLDIMKKYVIVRNTTKKLVIEDIESVGSLSK